MILAWLVHLYTALGAIVGFFSILAIEQGSFREAFFLMALTVVIDATDGTLARAARVKELIPWFDGNLLDEIVDYLNFVIAPCFFLVHAGLLPPQDSLWLAALPLLASAYGFCRTDAKTADNFFLGFPSYWNIVVFYLYVLQAPLWVNAFLIIALSILVFVPIKFILPEPQSAFSRVDKYLGRGLGAPFGITDYRLPHGDRTLAFASLLFPAYYTALSLWLEFRRLTTQSSPRG